MGLPWKKIAKWAIEQAAKWADKKLVEKKTPAPGAGKSGSSKPPAA